MKGVCPVTLMVWDGCNGVQVLHLSVPLKVTRVKVCCQSTSYGGATYSLADFRPPQDTATYKPVPMSFSSPRRRHSKVLMGGDSHETKCLQNMW
ncbi:hypothetical protein NQ317_006125 [Molorchus minor]|uniref:Uncharacterized protein n=1 Tax=Molorchus minor TaxID=1323400 RepID=A0ABQ9IXX5_9CUCU|nr:hypothetical protein NQ317_006125 [Molorchus minor]